jgi:hypothetical protein
LLGTAWSKKKENCELVKKRCWYERKRRYKERELKEMRIENPEKLKTL